MSEQPEMQDADATNHLLGIIEETLQQVDRLPRPKETARSSRHAGDIITLACVVIYIVYYTVFLSKGESIQSEKGYIATAGVIAVLYAIDVVYSRLRKFNRNRELRQRLQKFCAIVKKFGINYDMRVNIPKARSIRLYQVRRSGAWRIVPSILLVKDDVIRMRSGELFPAGCVNIKTVAIGRHGDVFAPTFFDQQEKPSNSLPELDADFRLLETPLKEPLCSILSARRPLPALEQEYRRLSAFSWNRCVPVLLLLSLLVGVIRLASSYASFGSPRRVFELLALNTATIILPLMPLAYSILREIMVDFASARLVTLFNTVQRSKRDFEEEEDEDEFDAEAPPPLKDVDVNTMEIVSLFLRNLVCVDTKSLSRSTGIVESFADVSFMSCVDREGTVAASYPSAEQIIVTETSGELLALDLMEDDETATGIRFEDADWKSSLPLLRPIALPMLLSANCGIHGGKIRPEHHRRLTPHLSFGAHVARQACLCRIALEVGIPELLADSFNKTSDMVVTRSADFSICPNDNPNFEIQSLTISSWTDGNEKSHVFAEGSPSLLLSMAIDCWNGQQLVPLDESMRRRWQDVFTNARINDIYCLAIGYRPSAPPTAAGVECISELDSDKLTYLGIVTLAASPKEDVCDFVADLASAGIRFTYFSPFGERESKAFAGRLGLETDWNSCVLLSDESRQDGGYMEQFDIKARLPRGPAAIRCHLTQVDDIPLHVSLFAECTPSNIKEMVHIFQEYGETVCCLGSSLNPDNAQLFMEADVSVGFEPFRTRLLRSPSGRDRPNALAAGAFLISLPCSLFLQYDTSPFILLQAVRDARRLVSSLRQCTFFLACINIAMFMVQFFAVCFEAPPAFQAYHIILFECLIVPIVAFAFFSDTADEEVMKFMPAKKNRELSKKALLFQTAVRAAAVAVSPLVTYLLALHYAVVENGGPGSLGVCNQASSAYCRDADRFSWLQVQHYSLLLFTYATVLASWTFLSRTRPVYERPITVSRQWIGAVSLSLAITLAFTLPLLIQHVSIIARIPWFVHVIAVLLPILLLPVQEIVKSHDTRAFIRAQKIAKLDFNTKLGQHSPI